LDDLLNPEHEISRLARAIDWDSLVAAFGPLYADQRGRPGVPIRLMAGIVLLQQTFGVSDEKVVETWVQNPYWQYFCGEEFFQHAFPIDPSSLSRWRGRIGKDGVEKLLGLTIQAGRRTKTVTEKELEIVIVDTTVQPKAVAHPTDARLYLKALHALVRIAAKHEIKLRQSYTKSAKGAHFLYGRYRKAKQFRRAAREQKKLKVYAGRVLRDLERKMNDEEFRIHRGTMILTELLLTQEKTTKGKVYSMHAPETECDRRKSRGASPRGRPTSPTSLA
jgi:IS5 family transposase